MRNKFRHNDIIIPIDKTKEFVFRYSELYDKLQPYKEFRRDNYITLLSGDVVIVDINNHIVYSAFKTESGYAPNVTEDIDDNEDY